MKNSKKFLPFITLCFISFQSLSAHSATLITTLRCGNNEVCSCPEKRTESVAITGQINGVAISGLEPDSRKDVLKEKGSLLKSAWNQHKGLLAMIKCGIVYDNNRGRLQYSLIVWNKKKNIIVYIQEFAASQHLLNLRWNHEGSHIMVVFEHHIRIISLHPIDQKTSPFVLPDKDCDQPQSKHKTPITILFKAEEKKYISQNETILNAYFTQLKFDINVYAKNGDRVFVKRFNWLSKEEEEILEIDLNDFKNLQPNSPIKIEENKSGTCAAIIFPWNLILMKNIFEKKETTHEEIPFIYSEEYNRIQHSLLLSWSPDEKMLAFSIPQYFNKQLRTVIRVLDIEYSRYVNTIKCPINPESTPTSVDWSSDSKKIIATYQNGMVWTHNAIGEKSHPQNAPHRKKPTLKPSPLRYGWLPLEEKE